MLKEFERHLKSVRAQQRREAMHRRIKFYLLRYQRKFGESPEIRKQNTLRNILTFTALPAIDQCVKKSNTIIKIFMKK